MKTWKFGRTALVIALAMTIILSVTGGTIAWFTDEVTSERNVIQSGNLDIELEYKKPGDTEWQPVTANTKVFDDSTLWEPGHTEIVGLRIKNAGTLALKYDLKVHILEEKSSINVYGKEFKLSDYLVVGHSAIQQDNQVGDILMGMVMDSREDAQKFSTVGFDTSVPVPTPSIQPQADMKEGENAAHVMALAIYMPTTVGNEANHKTGVAAPKITFGIDLRATQFTYEKDAFDNQYDEDATFPEESNSSDYPQADVKAENGVTMKFRPVDLANMVIGSEEKDYTLETKLTFTATDTNETLEDCKYRYWNGDFTVSVDKPVPAGVIGLAGKYGELAFAFDVTEDLCKMMKEGSTVVPANTKFRLLDPFGFHVNYDEICNNVKEFICGVYFTENATEEQKAALEGTTMTVTLNLYETVMNPSGKPSETEVEPKNSIWIGTYQYEF